MLDSFIFEFINNFGYLGIFLLITLENLFPPIPSEVILLFGGFVTTYTNLKPIFVILFATLGSVVGSIILYYIGHYFDLEKIYSFCESKYGKILHIKKKNVKKTYEWFLKHGYKSIFWCRLLPILRSLISIPAGMTKIDFKKFLLLTFTGSIIWNTVLVYLGVFSSIHLDTLASIFKSCSKFILLIVVVVFIIRYMYKKRKKPIN